MVTGSRPREKRRLPGGSPNSWITRDLRRRRSLRTESPSDPDRARLKNVPTALLDSRLAIVGPGRAARALARSWIRAGGRLGEVVARSAEAAQEAVIGVGGGQGRILDAAAFDCDIL